MQPEALSAAWSASFYWRLLSLALPITLQTLLFSGKGMLDTLMLASLGEIQVAAAGAASKFLFVATMFILGLAGGSAQLFAQAVGAWQAQADTPSPLADLLARSVQILAGFASLICLALALNADRLMGWLCQDAATAALASRFLIIMSLSFPLFAYTSSIYAALRTLGQAGVASWFCGLGVLLNIVFNILLIYGYAGLPALGSTGAAFGTLASAIAETVLLWAYLNWRRHSLAVFPWFKLADKTTYFKQISLSLQIAANASLWALGSFCFFAILGSQSASSLVLLSLLAPLESLAMAFLIGVATAAAILIGQTVGAGQPELAQQQAHQALTLAWLSGAISALLCYLLKPWVLAAYPELTAATCNLFAEIYNLMALSLLIRAAALMLLAGILRAGGDNRFCLYLDASAQWLLLLPLSWLLANYSSCSVLVLYGLCLLEEVIKVTLAWLRLQRGQWLHQLWRPS